MHIQTIPRPSPHAFQLRVLSSAHRLPQQPLPLTHSLLVQSVPLDASGEMAARASFLLCTSLLLGPWLSGLHAAPAPAPAPLRTSAAPSPAPKAAAPAPAPSPEPSVDPKTITLLSSLLSPLFPSLAPVAGPTLAGLGGACINDSSPLFLALNFLPRAPQPSPFLEARHSFVLTVAQYDGWAAYYGPATGLVTGLRFKQTAVADQTCTNRALSLVYSLRAATSILYPIELIDLDALLIAFALDPGSTEGAAGVGVSVGTAVGKVFLNDKANQLGNLPDITFNRLPFSDWTGFAAVNSPYSISDISKWQPERLSSPEGFPNVQDFSGAQLGFIRSYSFSSATQFASLAPGPTASENPSSAAFKAQAQQIVDLSANLTDYDKIIAEFSATIPLGGPLNGIASFQLFLLKRLDLSLDRSVPLIFSQWLAVFEGLKVVFYYKRLYNAATPKSVIRHSGLFQNITAFGGPFLGTVEMPASQWQHYIPNAPPEPDYPDGAATLWTALQIVAQEYFQNGTLDYTVVVPPGGSSVEPGVTPKEELSLRFPTFDSITQQAYYGRLTSGLHFAQASRDAVAIGKATAPGSFHFAMNLAFGPNPYGPRPDPNMSS